MSECISPVFFALYVCPLQRLALKLHAVQFCIAAALCQQLFVGALLDDLAVGENDDIVRVADILSRKRIKKVPVIDNGKLVGVVSRSTIVRYIMQQLVKSAAAEQQN